MCSTIQYVSATVKVLDLLSPAPLHSMLPIEQDLLLRPLALKTCYIFKYLHSKGRKKAQGLGFCEPGLVRS